MKNKAKHFSQYPLSKCTTFQQGGEVTEFTTFYDLDELISFVKSSKEFFIVGKGSNSIINPNSSIKHIIQLAGEMFESEYDQNSVTFSAGTSVNEGLKFCVKNGLSCLEFAAGVPATIGGMVAMNFGCWGTEVSDIILSVKICDENGEIKTITKEEMDFSYRKSIFQERNWVILKVTLSYQNEDSERIKKTVHTYIKDRVAKQPIRSKTFGSIFRNPNNNFAAKLIEDVGLKGYEKGSVKISSQHANFMENTGLATYEEVKDMVLFIQQKVYEKFQIKLEPEVKFYE